jgi:Holliday junction resolvase
VKNPCFGSEPGKPIYCAECSRKRPNENLYDVHNPRCEDCRKKNPVFGNESGKRRFCADCARKRPNEGLYNTVNKRCKTPHCDTTVSSKYKGYCYRCFINIYPDNEIVRRHRTKERAVADFVRDTYPDLTIAFDRRVADGCSRRRPDIFVDMGAYVLVVEVDENKHEAYICSCENKRMMELFQDAGSRPLVMIRFNPDQYYDKRQKSVASCWGYTKDKGLCVVKPNKTAEWAQRLATLKTTLDLVIAQGTEKEIDVYHLYYDGF